MRSTKFALPGLLIALSLLISACGSQRNIPETTIPATTAAPVETEPDSRELVEEISVVVVGSDIYDLEQYPNLKTADLTGSTCYSVMETFAARHPELKVIYTVSMGGIEADHTLEDIALRPEEIDFETMLTNLRHLPNLKRLTLPDTDLTPEQLQQLEEAYPEVEMRFTVTLAGKEYPSDTDTLDLSFLTPGQVADAADALSRLPQLTYVELVDSNGNSSLSMENVKALVDAAPNANFHYVFTLFGKTISTTDETVEFKNLKLGNDREPEIRAALDIMTGCKTFILDECGMDNEVLANIRKDYDRTKLAWRIHFGKYNAMTNAETIRAVYNVFDDTSENLKYCTDVKYMDIGHNETLTDLSFVSYMPNLEILVASGCGVKSLDGFENCKNLEFLELAYCAFIKDLTPLAGCSNLKYLNICYTKVDKLMPLDGLNLEVLFSKRTLVAPAEQTIFKEIHPDCLAQFIGNEPYAGVGWRYVDNGKTYTDMYRKVRDVFGYDDLPS